MASTVVTAVTAAGILGVTHAIEPDHVAGIASLTSQYGDSRLSAVVGACFSLGHIALVVSWLTVGYLILGRTAFPDVFDAIGTLGVAVILTTLSAVMVVGGLRSVLHAHEHEHGGETHSHAHLHLPGFGADGGDSTHSHESDEEGRYLQKAAVGHSHADHGHRQVEHDHDHGVANYLKTGLVGALFTLSPPLSMIAFSSTLFPEYAAGVVALAVGAYAVSITATMSLIGAGVGTLFNAATISPRAYGAARVLGGVLVAALAVTMLTETVPILV